MATPPCSYTGVKDIVDLAVARGGDTNLLESLTSEAAAEAKQPRALLAEQFSTLKHALTRPNVQFLIYEVHTILPSETTEMIRQVVEYANQMAKEKYIREHPVVSEIPYHLIFDNRSTFPYSFRHLFHLFLSLPNISTAYFDIRPVFFITFQSKRKTQSKETVGNISKLKKAGKQEEEQSRTQQEQISESKQKEQDETLVVTTEIPVRPSIDTRSIRLSLAKDDDDASITPLE